MTIDDWRRANTLSPKGESRRASNTWRRIQRDPDTILLARGDTDVAAQTVHISIRSNNRQAEGDGGGRSSVTGATIVGVRKHPSVADTDVQKGDIFLYDGLRFQVTIVIDYPGRIEARCEAMS